MEMDSRWCLGPGLGGFNRFALWVVPIACRREDGTSSSSHASALPRLLATPCCHPKLERVKRTFKVHSLCTSIFQCGWPPLGVPPPRFQPDQIPEGPASPDAATDAQISTPEPLPLASGRSRMRQHQPCTGGGRGASPVLKVGRTHPLCWATLSSPCPALHHTFFQRI